ncbi:hypothetical protein C4900_06935 [Acidiferrobacter thiooxydans]|jgi:hypothetical protein|uniref:Uncharacterized protein n=1 Tax=Acidiferrobacter thiooxydans TaxID=163359 RepID=A0A1C2FZU2_9GAMM|nr:hypothetical protein C4900_06935 [Acidiferrobacter thiooxydans]
MQAASAFSAVRFLLSIVRTPAVSVLEPHFDGRINFPCRVFAAMTFLWVFAYLSKMSAGVAHR